MIYVFGSGGLALCAIDALLASGQKSITMVTLDDQKSKESGPYQVIHESQLLPNEVKNIFVAIGDNFKRHQLVEKLKFKFTDPEFVNCIHPSVSIGMSVQLGKGLYIGAQAVLGPQVQIGDFCILNCGAIVEHEGVFGDYVNVGTGSAVAGNVKIGSRSVLGVNTTILHGLTIGEDALLASGACVVNNVEPAAVMMGIPAKLKKRRQFGEPFL